jgi:hypothetical protein
MWYQIEDGARKFVKNMMPKDFLSSSESQVGPGIYVLPYLWNNGWQEVV